MNALKADLMAAAAAEYEATHEWRWVDGGCYVRERPSGHLRPDEHRPTTYPP
jgi:hypothetical protein